MNKPQTTHPSPEFIAFRDDFCLVTKAIFDGRPVTGDQMVEDAFNALRRLAGKFPPS